MKKRLLSILTAVALTVSMVACGKEANISDNGKEKKEAAGEE